MSIKRVSAAVGLCAVLALVAGCGGSKGSSSSASNSSAKSNTPFTILYIGDLSGATKVLGEAELVGNEAAVDYLNENGGIDGHKVVLVKESDNGESSTATQVLLKYLASHPAPQEVWPGSESVETGALLPILARKKILAIDNNDGPSLLAKDATKYPEQFSEESSLEAPDASVAAYFKKQGYKKVGIAEEEFDYAEGETPIMIEALEKEGIAHTVVKVPATATNVTPEMSQLQSQKVEAVYYEGVAAPAGYGLVARGKLGWNVPFVGDLAFAAFDTTTLVPNDSYLKGVKLVVFKPDPDYEASSSAVKTLKKYMERHGGTPKGLLLSVPAESWDSQLLVRDAAKQAGSIEAPAIASALEKLNPDTDPLFTVYEHYKFTEENHEQSAATPADYPIVGAGPLVEGQVHSLEK